MAILDNLQNILHKILTVCKYLINHFKSAREVGWNFGTLCKDKKS